MSGYTGNDLIGPACVGCYTAPCMCRRFARVLWVVRNTVNRWINRYLYR